MVNLFYETHKEELEKYDGFVVTFSPSFALLYEKFNKPIIIINATRYEQPATHNGSLEQWEWINKGLKRLDEKKLLINISNNLFDKIYLKEGSNIDSIHIPSLCLYTNVSYDMIDRNNINLPKITLLYSSLKNEYTHLLNSLNLPNLFSINQIKPYDYIDIIKARCIIHIPYEISTMSIFEHYSMNIPLIFPSKEFMIKLYKSDKINFYGSYAELFQTKLYPEKLSKLLNKDWFENMIEYTDYYDKNNMPYITYFNSFEELPFILNSLDYKNISNKMKQFNMKRRLRVFQTWSRLLIDSFSLGSLNMKPLNESVEK